MNSKEQEQRKIFKSLQNSVISHKFIPTIYGNKPLVYADYTASGRCLTFVEDYIRKNVDPLYANTHTEISQTGLYTTQLRENSRTYIKQVCGATELDALIFVGSGATTAVNLLTRKLGLQPKQVKL